MWNVNAFLNQYRRARKERRVEALRAFRLVLFPSVTDLLEIYPILRRDRSRLATLLLREARTQIRQRTELHWRNWFKLCVQHGLGNWIGRYAQRRFFASIPANASFATWYRRWRHVITQPHAHFVDTYARVPMNILKRLLMGMIEAATTLADWCRVYDAPSDYGYGTKERIGSYTSHRPFIGAENTRRRAWAEIKHLLP